MAIGSIPAILVHGYSSRPESLEAPAPWPREAGLLVAESLLAAFGEGMRNWRSALVRGPLFTAAMIGLAGLRRRAERAQARRIDLTALTAPQRSWRRAYAAAAGRSPQARSSAESSTSGGCAPDTP